jgi:hypothetical protein
MLPYLFCQGRVVFGLQVSTAVAQQGTHLLYSSFP